MPLRSVSAAYLTQAADLAGNPGQQAAYDSTGNCVVLAGPGSGKTKTLVLKLARIPGTIPAHRRDAAAERPGDAAGRGPAVRRRPPQQGDGPRPASAIGLEQKVARLGQRGGACGMGGRL